MKRLPIKFEEEVLNEHSIYWEKWNTYEGYVKSSNYLTGEAYDVTPYEIAGISIEYLKDYNLTFNYYVGKDLWVISDIINGQFEDEDFCMCIFKAINQIYGKKE